LITPFHIGTAVGASPNACCANRHLIGIDDQFGLLVSHNKVPSDLARLFPPSGVPIHLPNDLRLHPRQDYVARHRAKFIGDVL
jgi:putative restriction endonuclease